MRPLVAFVALACVAPTPLAAQDAGAFVVRIGRDTIGLERVTRTATRITGEYLLRSPRPLHALYTVDLNADGTIRHLEVTSHNIAGGPGPKETRSVLDIAGDSATLTLPRGDSSVTQRVAAGPGTVVWLGYVAAMFEQMGRQALAAGGAHYAVPMLTMGPLAGTMSVEKSGGDTLLATITVSIGVVGPLRMVLDHAGRLTWMSGVGTPLQVVVDRVPSVDIDAATPAFVAHPLGTLSPRDTARATLGGAELWVDYGRPTRRGREIFGQVVPWNAVWRTGANAATQFHTPVDLLVGGAAVPAGTYTLWTLPSPTGWKLIINSQTGQWGTDYHADKDFVRVAMRVDALPEPVEQLMITIEPEGTGATLRVAWDRTRVSVPLARKP